MFLPAKHGMSELSPDVIRGLQLRYPLCNVPDQLLLYNLWLQKNPARRPKRLLRGVENWLKKASPKAPMVDLTAARWWSSEQNTLVMAHRLGLTPKPGEEWPKLRERIRERLSEGSPTALKRSQANVGGNRE